MSWKCGSKEYVTGDYLAALAAIHGSRLRAKNELLWVFDRPDKPDLVVTIPRGIPAPLGENAHEWLMRALGLTDADL